MNEIAEAAARLGMTADAIRWRLRQGQPDALQRPPRRANPELIWAATHGEARYHGPSCGVCGETLKYVANSGCVNARQHKRIKVGLQNAT